MFGTAPCSLQLDIIADSHCQPRVGGGGAGGGRNPALPLPRCVSIKVMDMGLFLAPSE